MNSSPDDFKDLRHLLALKKHEEPPPGYFSYLPDKIVIRIERGDLSEHSTWWEWLVAKFDAQPVLAGAYAFAISGLMLLGLKVSEDLPQRSSVELLPGGVMAHSPDPLTFTPSTAIQPYFANPAGLINFTSTEPIYEDPVSHPPSSFQRVNFAH